MPSDPTLKTVVAQCKKCKHTWNPYGITPVRIPFVRELECPKCHNIDEYQWLDEETQKKITQRELGLLEDNTELNHKIELLTKEIEVIKSGRDADRKEIQLLRQIIDLTIQKQLDDIKQKNEDHLSSTTLLIERIDILEKDIENIRKGI